MTAQSDNGVVIDDSRPGVGGGGLQKPRFPDQPARPAPPVQMDTERSLHSLKHKILTIYRNHRRPSEPNVSREVQGQLKELKEAGDVIIKPSDKCKGFVVLNKADYVAKAETITAGYEPVTSDPTRKTEALTKRVISSTMTDKVDPKIVSALVPHNSRTAELYGLPKNHKPHVPLRPIVSAIDDPVDKLTWFLQQIITQLLPYVPAHLRNTDDYLSRLRTKYPTGFPAGAIAFSVDVENLYGNVPIDEAIDAAVSLLTRYRAEVDLFGLTPDDVKQLLYHCLNNNYLRFGDKYYRQTQGIAMGSRVAPPLAIVFMGSLEALILSQPREQPDMFVRYVDDVFGIWTHGESSLTSYLTYLNSVHPNIKFTMERSDVTGMLPFLDTVITVNSNGSYSTELYFKPMAAPIILHYDSAHPVKTKTSVLISQLKRAVRLSSTQAAKERSLNKIRDLFLRNGYPKRLIDKHIHQIGQNNNSNKRPKNKNSQNETYMKLPFIDDDLARKIASATRASGLSMRVAWTNKQTLRNTLVRSALEPTPCPSGSRRCHACHAGLQQVCHTKNVVYELECGLCGDKYVGETKRPVRLRYNEHLRDGSNRTFDTPIGDHFITKHPEQNITDHTLKAKIIRRCTDEADRKISESITIRDATPSLNTYTASWPLLRP